MNEVNVSAMSRISDLGFGIIFGIFRIVFLWDFAFEMFHLIIRIAFFFLRKTGMMKGKKFYLYVCKLAIQINK